MNLVIEMMSDEQLDRVSGGTCQETDELIRAIGSVDVRVREGHTHYQATYSTEHRQLKHQQRVLVLQRRQQKYLQKKWPVTDALSSLGYDSKKNLKSSPSAKVGGFFHLDCTTSEFILYS